MKVKYEKLAKDGLKLCHFRLKLRMKPTEKQKEQSHQTIGNALFTYTFI
jgi:putative transposase